MEHRLGRTVRVFLIVLAAAGFHRLTIVPLVEPRVHDAAAAVEMSPEQAAAIRARADKRLAALGEIFPAGSWEREDPIVLESRQMRLLFRQYQALPDGRVHLVPCTLVILPDRNRVAGDGDAGRTLVLRVPQGAVLEFDEPLDLRQGRLARLIGGSLRGQVTIRGTPSAPGAEDDIEIVTRDVELAELEVRTTEAVQFRYGRSTGSGRAMIARLLPRAEASENGPSIGGVDSIRLDRDVKLRLEGLQGGLLPGGSAAAPANAPPAAQNTAAGQQAAAEPPPVFVSCRGGLSLNVSANVITFEERVEVVRTAADGATDQLDCEQLAIVLARRDPAAEGRGGLEPASIQAKGRPVVARSSAAGLEARAARLGYEVATRRILLDGEEPVSLVARDTEMEARSIDYVPGPGSGPGALMAVGPGLLRTRSGGGPPVQARWQKWLRMRPDGAGHVASIAGDAEVAVEAQGRLAGSEMHLWLDIDQSSPAAAAPAGRAGPDLSGVKPSRLLARGMVEIEADQLTARTDRMEVWFRNQPAAATAVAAAPAGTAAGAASIPAQAARQPVAHAPLGAAPQPKTPATGRIVATAALIRGLVTMGGQQGELEEMSLEGQVHVVEEGRAAVGGPAVPRAPGGEDAEAGLEIRGDQMQLTRPTRFDARAIVSGRPAEVRGRGLDLSGPLVDFDRGRNRLTVDGAGRLQVPLAAGAGGLESFSFTGSGPQVPAPGAPAAPPGALDVTWQGRMDFDGLTARFVDQVVTSARGSEVRAGSLDVVFNRPVEFTAARQQPAVRPDVARIACGSGVKIESETTSQDGAKSMERLFVRDLVIDRTTGNVTGTGPGRLTSTRFGQAPAMALPAAGPAGAAAAPPPARPDELTFLGVDFQRGMRGNLERRVMEFHQRVEAIWGPVAGWNDTLDPRAPTGLPPRVVTISSDVLGVGQVPPAPGQRRGSIEIAAGGNVLVEGEAFTARSARLTWSEAKDLLVFEGDGRSDAQLFRQAKIGAATSSASAGKILYWRALNRVDVDDARFLDLDQIGAGASGLKAPGSPLGPAGPAKPVSRPLPGT
jgi:hypothetical protein